MIRGRRALLHEVRFCVNSLLGPLGIEMEVVPCGMRWEWAVYLTIGGYRSMLDYEVGTWRRPGPHELHGRCRTPGDAWLRARSVANDVRAVHAAIQVTEMRRHGEGFQL